MDKRQDCEQLDAAIKRAIRQRMLDQGGWINFAEYMELCLYYPDAGYYMRSAPKLGKCGDFYTSAHIGGVMGSCIAARLKKAAEDPRLPQDGPFALVEWGGGDGRLAEAVLNELASAAPDFYKNIEFLSVESSPYHRELQRSRLQRHEERLAGIVPPADEAVWRTLATRTTLLYANELLDAFPVHRLRRERGEWRELVVGWDDAAGAFQEQTAPIGDTRIAPWLEKHSITGEEGQTIEVGLAAMDWIATLGAKLQSGFVLLADYGDDTGGLIAPNRMNGTVLAYRNHRASTDLYDCPGRQDVTAHVNFEWCVETAAQAGFTGVNVTTQKQFLLEQGILRRLQNHSGADPFSPQARTNRAIRQLLLSDGMSETFKVMTMFK